MSVVFDIYCRALQLQTKLASSHILHAYILHTGLLLNHLFRSSKPSLTSKPLLTIALKILKTIEKPLKICNGLFTFLDPRYVDLYALEEDVLQRIVEDISRCYLIFHSSLKYLDMILSSFGDMILTRDSIINLKTIVDHCPQNFENHRKTIGSNGWTPQKTFNGDGPTLSKPLKNHQRQWWPKKNINHSIVLKN